MVTQRGFGNIQKLPSGKFRARYVHPTRSYVDGKRNYVNAPKTFVRKTDASAWLAGVESDISRGVWVDPKKVKEMPTLGEYAERWLETLDIRDSTLTAYKNQIAHFGKLAEMPIDEITVADIKDWAATACPGKPAARGNAYARLTQIFNEALDSEIINRSPCRPGLLDKMKNAPLPDGKSPRRERVVRQLSPEQIASLALELKPEYREPTLLMGQVGLRVGEVVELREKDLSEDVLRVARTAVKGGKTNHTKTGKTRDVVLTPDRAKYLRDRLTGDPERLLYPSPTGGRTNPDALSQAITRAGEKAGLGHVSAHDLRHSAGSNLAEAGVSLVVVRDMLGHTKLDMTSRYLHSSLEDQKNGLLTIYGE